MVFPHMYAEIQIPWLVELYRQYVFRLFDINLDENLIHVRGDRNHQTFFLFFTGRGKSNF